MREFVLPFKPEELLAQPSDDRLWASSLPDVESWSEEESCSQIDSLIGRLLSSQGHDLMEEESFCLVFAFLQAWPRLDEDLHARIADLLADAARRLVADVVRLKKAGTKAKSEDTQQLAAGREARTVSKVAVFFTRWATERALRKTAAEAPRRGRKKTGGEDDEKEAEAKERLKAVERGRVALLGALADLMGKGAMPWLWLGDPGAFQQVAEKVSDGGFDLLDSSEALKHREARQLALRCITAPLLQEGHQHSNLLVATVSKLLHGLRSGEAAAPFVADVLLLAHTTPLPRLFLVDLTQHCNAAELCSQREFQRVLGLFLVAAAERLPHVILANISVLLPLLDVDCYPLRTAIVECIGKLLEAEGKELPKGAHCGTSGAEVACGDTGNGEGAASAEAADGEGGRGDGEDAQAVPLPADAEGRFAIALSTKQDLLDTLMARSLDKTVWVRVRVLQTFTNLASNTRIAALPRDLWPQVLDIAIKRMQDSASSARKASMQVVKKLIEFHPYGPALKGCGDERAKAEHMLGEIAARIRTLAAADAAEAEEEARAHGVVLDEDAEERAAPTGDDEDEDAGAAVHEEEQPNKRQRLLKKTEETPAEEVDRCLAVEVQAAGAASGAATQAGCTEKGREERARQQEALKKMYDCYSQRFRFIELIDSAEARLRALLLSRTPSDVTEAISVVVELKVRGLPAAARAFDQVLGLVWSRHAAVKDAAVEAFHHMHLEGRSPPEAVSALLQMYEKGCAGGGWTYTHLASVQELIQQAATQDLVDPGKAMPHFVNALPGAHCPLALRALAALAAASASQFEAELPRLVELFGAEGAATGDNAVERLERVRLLCQLLQRFHGSLKQPPRGASWQHLFNLSQRATHVVIEHFGKDQVPPQWFAAAQAAVDFSFDLASSANVDSDPASMCPDKVWEQILEGMILSIYRCGGGAVGLEEAADTMIQTAGDGDVASVNVAAPKLGCVVFVAGHLALRMLVYLEGLQASLKRKRMSEEDARMAEQREKREQKQEQKKKSKKGKGKGKDKGEEEAEEEDEEAEATGMGMAGQEEREADAFAEMAETTILYGPRSILHRIMPLIRSGLLNPNQRCDPILRRLAAISLCKFMTVSKRFCEEHVQLLFSVLFPKSRDASVMSCDGAEGAASDSTNGMGALFEDLTLRQSLLVAVGDLLFRHPNVVEPWTDRLYNALSMGASEGSEFNSAAELRLTALLVLTHLVLNDMMKPRAVLLVRALWLTACPHEATARVARILFQELSKRSTNVVYNLLPEIVSRLAEQQCNTGDGAAEKRVQYIMQFIEKEKHVEGLIEKLTVRLEQCADVAGRADGVGVVGDVGIEECDDETPEGTVAPSKAIQTVSCLAHAVGSMNYSDRCVLRLHDVVVVRRALKNAISYHSVVRENILGIVEKARKPKVGKGAADAGAPAPEAESAPAVGADSAGAAAQKGGPSPAAIAAIDAIEKIVTAACGQVDSAAVPISDGAAGGEEAGVAGVPTPMGRASNKAAKKGKRKQEATTVVDPENPGFEPAEQEGRRGRGRGRGSGRGAATKGSGGVSKGERKRRRAGAEDDEDHEE